MDDYVQNWGSVGNQQSTEPAGGSRQWYKWKCFINQKHVNMILLVFIKFSKWYERRKRNSWHPPAVDSWCLSLAWTRCSRRLRRCIIGPWRVKHVNVGNLGGVVLTVEDIVFKWEDEWLWWIVIWRMPYAKASKNPRAVHCWQMPIQTFLSVLITSQAMIQHTSLSRIIVSLSRIFLKDPEGIKGCW